MLINDARLITWKCQTWWTPDNVFLLLPPTTSPIWYQRQQSQKKQERSFRNYTLICETRCIGGRVLMDAINNALVGLHAHARTHPHPLSRPGPVPVRLREMVGLSHRFESICIAKCLRESGRWWPRRSCLAPINIPTTSHLFSSSPWSDAPIPRHQDNRSTSAEGHHNVPLYMWWRVLVADGYTPETVTSHLISKPIRWLKRFSQRVELVVNVRCIFYSLVTGAYGEEEAKLKQLSRVSYWQYNEPNCFSSANWHHLGTWSYCYKLYRTLT